MTAPISPYCSRTGTKTTLAALRAADWGLLVSATGVHRNEGMRYVIDNGAYTAFQQGTEWDQDAFVSLVTSMGPGAEWIAAPDIVAGGYRSFALSMQWVQALAGYGQVLIPVQDGQSMEVVAPYLNEHVGIFLGGSTEWKLETMKAWGEVARERDCYYHVARVNTQKRISMAQHAGAHSFDGTSVTCFPKTLNTLNRARSQQALDFGA